MKFISINTGEYYDKPEFYPYMPENIFNALEAAELKRTNTEEKITAEVPKEEFQKMIDDFNSANNGS